MQTKTLAVGSVAIAAAVGNLIAGGGAASSYSAPMSGGKSMAPAPASMTGAATSLAGGTVHSFADSLEAALKPIWGLGTLYEGDGMVSEFGFHGRYHGQYYWADGTDGNDDDYETRRLRFGPHLDLSNGFELEATFDIEVDDDFDVSNLYSAGIHWEGDNGLHFGIGKLKPEITAEYTQSSKRILTLERSLLVNQVVPATTGAVRVGGEANGLGWEVYGMFGGVDGDYNLPTTEGGFNALGRLSYELSDTTTGHFHYLWHDDDADNDTFKSFDNVFSLGATTKTDAGGLITDLIYATGDADVYGLIVMPYYNLTDRLRFVVRGQYAASDSGDGLRLQRRYERTVADGDRGDSYWAAYAGLNYYIMGDKLKLMSGLEYSDLSGDNDYDGWTLLTGLRLYF